MLQPWELVTWRQTMANYNTPIRTTLPLVVGPCQSNTDKLTLPQGVQVPTQHKRR